MGVVIYDRGRVVEEWTPAGVVNLSTGEVTPLTAEQAATVAAYEAQEDAQAARVSLSDPEAVRAAIDALRAQVDAYNVVLATPNPDVNASPAKHIMAVARAGKRTARETIRALRLLGGVLDSTDMGVE